MCLVDQLLGQRTVEGGEQERLCKNPGLNRFSARTAEEVVPWEFFNKPVFSQFHNNPKRGMEASLSGSLDDAVMQVWHVVACKWGHCQRCRCGDWCGNGRLIVWELLFNGVGMVC